jgi:hypothetical protein
MKQGDYAAWLRHHQIKSGALLDMDAAENAEVIRYIITSRRHVDRKKIKTRDIDG